MTEQKKLTRRDAIKLIGAAAGASVLANIPAKWSKPSLAGGLIPAHAQTSNCGPGTSYLMVEFLEINGEDYIFSVGPMSQIQYTLSQTPPYSDGLILNIECTDICFGFGFVVSEPSSLHVRISLNGVVVATFNSPADGEQHTIYINGATGEYNISDELDPPSGCLNKVNLEYKKNW